MSIYKLMMEDWRIYCLMASIMYIEEASKPAKKIQIKKYKDKEHKYLCFQSVRLKMKNKQVIEKLFNITKYWEIKKKIPLIGKSFRKIRKENGSKQFMFLFTPVWLNYILMECGRIPNKHSFEIALDRINNLKQYQKLSINKNKNLFNLLLKDKRIAAGAFILTMDLEARGMQFGRVSLCMSEKYKDFLEFMLAIAQKWGWTNNKKLSDVKVDYGIKRGIKASPQYEFRINIKGLQEMYGLAGPLADSFKDKCINLHVTRSKNYVNLGGKFRYGNTKEKIFQELKKNKKSTTTSLQFIGRIGVDVVLQHLHNLEKEGKIKKERKGKRYVWSIKCQ